jgi:hypothetical protein
VVLLATDIVGFMAFFTMFFREHVASGMSKILNTKKLALELSIPERTITSLRLAGKISCLKVGHRTVLFDVAKVRTDLANFEIKAVEV